MKLKKKVSATYFIHILLHIYRRSRHKQINALVSEKTILVLLRYPDKVEISLFPEDCSRDRSTLWRDRINVLKGKITKQSSAGPNVPRKHSS
jgi:hypothetical protein